MLQPMNSQRVGHDLVTEQSKSQQQLRVSYQDKAGNKKRTQEVGPGLGTVKAELSLLGAFSFIFSFLSAFPHPFFDQCQICPNWHLYYGRSRPGSSKGWGV